MAARSIMKGFVTTCIRTLSVNQSVARPWTAREPVRKDAEACDLLAFENLKNIHKIQYLCGLPRGHRPPVENLCALVFENSGHQ